jgi:hypothetical protein
MMARSALRATLLRVYQSHMPGEQNTGDFKGRRLLTLLHINYCIKALAM